MNSCARENVGREHSVRREIQRKRPGGRRCLLAEEGGLEAVSSGRGRACPSQRKSQLPIVRQISRLCERPTVGRAAGGSSASPWLPSPALGARSGGGANSPKVSSAMARACVSRSTSSSSCLFNAASCESTRISKSIVPSARRTTETACGWSAAKRSSSPRGGCKICADHERPAYKLYRREPLVHEERGNECGK